MSLSALQLYEIGRVFDPGVEPALYHPSAASELLLPRLLASLPAEGSLTVLTGESGAGKSLLIGVALQRLQGVWAHGATLHFTAMDADELLCAIAHALGIRLGRAAEGEASLQDAILAEMARRVRRGERSLLVVDDAHGLATDALRLLHRLSRVRPDGRPLLHAVLVGAPKLLDHLRDPTLSAVAMDFHPQLEAGAFLPQESRTFVQQRLAQCAGDGLPKLKPLAVQAVHEYGHGLPGRLQMLCRELLHQALMAEDATPIGPERVAEIAAQLGFTRMPPSRWAGAEAAQAARPVALSARLRWPLLLIIGSVLAGWSLVVLMRAPLPATPVIAMPAPAASAVIVAAPLAPPPPLVPQEAPQEAPRVAPVDAGPALVPKPVAVALVAAAPRPRASNATSSSPRECSALLTQISLGEPLNPKQRHTLETLCR